MKGSLFTILLLLVCAITQAQPKRHHAGTAQHSAIGKQKGNEPLADKPTTHHYYL